MVVAMIYNFYLSKTRFQLYYLWTLVPFLFTVFMLLFGTIMNHNISDGIAPSWPGYALFGLAISQLICTGLLIYKMKGIRWATISLGVFQLLCSTATWFVAGMSVTGDWL
jgi:hypothetical protein